MLFNNYYFLNRLIKDLTSFDDNFFTLNPNIRGKETTESGTDDNGGWERKTFTSHDGSFTYSFFTKSSNNKNELTELDGLKMELESCVNKQDFERAAEIRDKIKNIETNKDKLNKLNLELEECIKSQDFERAIKVRDNIKKLK